MTAPSTAVDSALRCDGVSAGHRKVDVVHDVSFDVPVGGWLSVIGPNGAGKSTLLRSIAGLLPHTGTISVGSSAVPTAADVALVPQNPMLPPGMTVAEYVLLGRTAHLGWLASETASDRHAAAVALDRLDLGGFAGRFVTELSGGETQRVVVARALAQASPLLLLDEPTSALDLGHQVAVLELIDQIRREDGLTVVAAMHDLTLAARFADDVLLLKEGRAVRHGVPAEVFDETLLSEVYGTPVTVMSVDDDLVVIPRTRR